MALFINTSVVFKISLLLGLHRLVRGGACTKRPLGLSI